MKENLITKTEFDQFKALMRDERKSLQKRYDSLVSRVVQLEEKLIKQNKKETEK